MRIRIALSALFLASRLAANVVEVGVQGVITSVSTEIVSDAIDQAGERHAEAVLIRLDTAGGSPAAVLGVVAAAARSSVPVLVRTGPSGARALSAGFLLLHCGDVASMAPGTTTAPPSRGHGAVYTDRQALSRRLIDLIAGDPADLLRQLEGREIRRFDGRAWTLHFAGVGVEPFVPSLRQRLLLLISAPQMALFLLVAGALGVAAECSRPGLFVPGIAGAALVVLSVAGFALCPLDWRGAALMAAAFPCLGLGAKFRAHGILALGGAGALCAGSTLLIDRDLAGTGIHPAVAAALTLPFSLIVSFLFSVAARARRAKAVGRGPVDILLEAGQPGPSEAQKN